MLGVAVLSAGALWQMSPAAWSSSPCLTGPQCSCAVALGYLCVRSAAQLHPSAVEVEMHLCDLYKCERVEFM